MRIYLLSLLLFFCTACSSSSQDLYKKEGNKISQALIDVLREVHTANDLQEIAPTLKNLFVRLAKIMMASQKYREKYNVSLQELTEEDKKLSRQLKEEFQRIYAIEGCRKIIEKCQQEALRILDINECRNKHKEHYHFSRVLKRMLFTSTSEASFTINS